MDIYSCKEQTNDFVKESVPLCQTQRISFHSIKKAKTTILQKKKKKIRKGVNKKTDVVGRYSYYSDSSRDRLILYFEKINT